MDGALLHVMTFTPRTHEAAQRALCCMRHAAGRKMQQGRTLLLFCDLPDADAQRLPQDEPLLRLLQSGVMAMDARAGGRFLLLVRRRAWDDASRAYLGSAQALSARQVIAQLLESGKTQAVFDAATFAPGAIKGQYAAVLFSDLSLACTPDTPQRMLRALQSSPHGCLCARVLPRQEYPQTALARLADADFSLSPLRAARADALARRGLSFTDCPTIYTPDALTRMNASPHASAPIAEGCFFVRRKSTALPELFAAQRRRCLRAGKEDLLPLLQTALLAAAALLGWGWLAGVAVLLPEAWVIAHLRLLPGALVRAALLPLTAAVTLDAALCRLLARSRHVRLRLPGVCFTARGCALSGGVLALLGLQSVQALPALLPVALLWLSAPLLMPALASPTIERIPLAEDQHAQLRSMAESAFFDAYAHDAPAPRAMLAACAGCMLALLEPDEAARRVHALLMQNEKASPDSPQSADHAALLVCAQFLRERMGDCDAALRGLPAQLETLALALQPPEEDGLLGAFLASARREDASDTALRALARAGDGHALDALFLPLGPAHRMAQHALSLPLTHPHTYLQRIDHSPETEGSVLDRFLFLAAAALGHPFYALLRRSPVAAPYTPLLDANYI